jgi:flavin-dependent dehydrogenase
VAYVIDRERFDKELSLGLNTIFENRFLGLRKVKTGYIIETDKQEMPADIVIGADGANSAIRRVLGLEEQIRQYRGVQFRVRVSTPHKDMVEVYLSKPSFFWVVPESEDIVRIGTISDNPHHDLEQFLRVSGIKGELLERYGGLTSLGICAQTVKDNIALVGDAACQVKPLTYGGIYFGLKSATILADCIKKDRLKDYDALWKKELASEIKIGLRAKDTYSSLTKDELGLIFKLLKSQRGMIEKIGDFENHSRIIFEILKRPSAYSQLGSLFSLLLKKLI